MKAEQITLTLSTDDVTPWDDFGSITVTEYTDGDAYAAELVIDTQDGAGSLLLTAEQIRQLRYALHDIEVKTYWR